MGKSSSFLPEDYLAQKAERRTNVVSLILFAIVMFAVFLAFMVTNRTWTSVRSEQAMINARYQQAAEQIRELRELEAQEKEMMNKAELAGALIERVPRSILLAEIINRMPDRLSLVDFELTSKKIKTVNRQAAAATEKNGRLAPGKSKRGKTKAQANPNGAPPVEAPRYAVEITVVGVAPTDLEVSRFLSELNSYPLLQDVVLDYSEEQEIQQQIMREFRLQMQLDPDADIREVAPRAIKRINNPMHGAKRFDTAQVPNGN